MTDQKRKYMVVKATQANISGVTVNGQDMKFGKKTHAFTVSDPGLANEIQAQRGAKYTGDVVVFPVGVQAERHHPRTFTVPEMPWKKKARLENGRTDGTPDNDRPGND